MNNGLNISDKDIELEKRGLIITLMKRRFEDNIYSILSKKPFTSIDELNDILDPKIKQYFAEMKIVDDYFNLRIKALEEQEQDENDI